MQHIVYTMQKATEQIHIRALKSDKRLISSAARATGRRKLTDYIMSTVLERARVDLADRPRLTMAGSDFQRFLARLDDEPRLLPGLRTLLDLPSAFEPHLPAHGIQDRASVVLPQG